MSFRPASAPAPAPTGRNEERRSRSPEDFLQTWIPNVNEKKKQQPPPPPPAEREEPPQPAVDPRDVDYWKQPGWRPWPPGLGAPAPKGVFDADASDAAWQQIVAHQAAAIEVVRGMVHRVHHRLEAVRPIRFVPALEPANLPRVGGSDEEAQLDFSATYRTTTFFEPFPSTRAVVDGKIGPDHPEADTWNERAARCAFVAAIELDGPALLALVRGFPEVMEVRGVGYQAPRRFGECVAQRQRDHNVQGQAAPLYCAVQEAMDKLRRERGIEPPPDAPVFGGASVHGCTVLFTLMHRAYAERTEGDDDALCGHSAVQHMVQSVYDAYVAETRLRYAWVGRAWEGLRTESAVALPVLEAGCDPFELPVQPDAQLPPRMEVAVGAGDSPLKLALQHDDGPTVRYLLAKLAPRLCERQVYAAELARGGAA